MKKRIFLFVNYYYSVPSIGTTKKIKEQILSLRNLGYSVFYTAYLEEGVAIFNDADEIQIEKKIVTNLSIFKKFIRITNLIKISILYLNNHKFDFFILRINFISRLFISLLKTMRQKGSVIMMETLSYFQDMKLSQLRGFGYFLIYYSIYFNRNNLKRLVDFALTEGPMENFFGIPAIEINMGVDVLNTTPHKYLGNRNEIHLVMVGCDSFYHGTDRILKSFKKYLMIPNNITIYLNLVGKILPKDQKLIKKLKIQSSVFLHGELHGVMLDRVYSNCNIALGPLAQFRAGKKDTGLKTKEYFARGIPYITSGIDSKVPNDYPYVLIVPNDNSIIDFKKIINFNNFLIKNSDIVNSMRNFSIVNFSWSTIYTNLFKYITNFEFIHRGKKQ